MRRNVPNETVIAAMIARADAEIDAYCGGRYSVPFVDPPLVIRGLSEDIAVYHLFGRRQGKMDEIRAEKYKAAIAMLKGISNGTVSLGVAAAETPGPADNSGAETNKETDTNIFSRESMGGF